jgi:hypothetical protein
MDLEFRPRLLEFLRARLADLGLANPKVLQIGKVLELLQAGVRDQSALKVQNTQFGQAAQFLQSSVRDLFVVAKHEPPQVLEFLQLLETRIGDIAGEQRQYLQVGRSVLELEFFQLRVGDDGLSKRPRVCKFLSFLTSFKASLTGPVLGMCTVVSVPLGRVSSTVTM